MKIIPPRTRPPESVIQRRHTPPRAKGRGGYRTYRSCLRWEFGFTCAFCLLHESDFSSHGAEGLGLMWIEHYVPISRKGRANDYSNCFYSCRLCNRSRSSQQIEDAEGRRLLNPCSDVWAEHFAAQEDKLRPRPDDADAEYTHAAYDLDDERKVVMRRSRREVLAACLSLVTDGYPKIQKLIDRADLESVTVARELRECLKLAVSQLKRHVAIPEDAGPCRCRLHAEASLPQPFNEQVIHVEIPLERTSLPELDDALETLARMDPRQAKIVELRYFEGLSMEEIAAALNISTATVKRELRVAKLWLSSELVGSSFDKG